MIMTKSPKQLCFALKSLVPQLERLLKAHYKAGYEKGFKVGNKSRTSKVLSKYRVVRK